MIKKRPTDAYEFVAFQSNDFDGLSAFYLITPESIPIVMEHQRRELIADGFPKIELDAEIAADRDYLRDAALLGTYGVGSGEIEQSDPDEGLPSSVEVYAFDTATEFANFVARYGIEIVEDLGHIHDD